MNAEQFDFFEDELMQEWMANKHKWEKAIITRKFTVYKCNRCREVYQRNTGDSPAPEIGCCGYPK